MEKWTSRARVLKAIDHQEPDRVPISFADTMNTGILECPPHGKNYTRLCEYLGIESYQEPDIGHLMNVVGNVDDRIRQKFGSDFRLISPNGPEVRIETDGTKTLMGVYCGIRVKKMGYYDDVFEFPLKDFTSPKDLERYPYWPRAVDFEMLAERKREEVEDLRVNTNYAIVADGDLAFPFLMYALLAGYDKWLMDMKLNPKFYFALSDKLLEIGIHLTRKFLGAVGEYIDVVATYDDMGTQQGLLCSRKDYVKFIKTYEKQILAEIRKHTDAKICRHSCGSVYEIIPDFIEMGIDILNPVQPLAKNMEPRRLKREFGKDLTFFGGIDIQRLLPRGTPEEVRKGVKKVIEIYAPGGGYVLGPSHNIEPDTPPENIIAMYEAAQEYGKYPIGGP